MMSRILLVHLSDLHLGDGYEGSEDLISGFRGHSLAMATKLPENLRQILYGQTELDVTANDVVCYLMGGDLTRRGSQDNFHLGYGYLKSQWELHKLQSVESVGLKLSAQQLHVVPGNHDHWDGFLPGPKGIRPPAFQSWLVPDGWFSKTPWRQPIPNFDGSLVLELLGVDSNSGLAGQATNLRAQGSISSTEWQELTNHLVDIQGDRKKSQTQRVTAIACHHAFDWQGGVTDARPLQPAEVQRMILAGHQYEVRAVLTGHTHDFHEQRHAKAKNPNVWELRCGTTLHQDADPNDPQGFWIHEIAPGSKVPEWKAWRVQWDGQDFRRKDTAITID